MIFFRPSGGKFCIRSMPMKDNDAKQYIIVGALSCSEGIATRLSDKGMASAQ